MIKSGNVVGYHVTQPCEVCMSACNNGHFWMFHNDSVKAKERMDATGKFTSIINLNNNTNKKKKKFV